MNSTKTPRSDHESIGPSFFVEFWEESWTYIKTVVDVLREPVLILDKNFKVLAANEAFFRLFKVEPKDTEGKIVYQLGNGQWDIPDLRKLLEDILPKDTFFKGFEVTHKFPSIGKRTVILNARHIHSSDKTGSEIFPSIIMLAMEDITQMITVASKVTRYTSQLEKALLTQAEHLEDRISILENKLATLTKDK